MMCKCGHSNNLHYYCEEKAVGCAIDDCKCNQFNSAYPKKTNEVSKHE